ncbi:MAG: araG [Caulobacter sp.]|nr:araG [Caulobacter sp.]
MDQALLSYAGVGKTFPGVIALADVSFSVRPGEIRALMGENGAGKSTLLKILAGEYRPDSGAVIIDGQARTFASPRDSAAAGVAIIHQELHLVPDLSVAENLLLGDFPRRGGFLDHKALRARAVEILARLGEDIDPNSPVRALSIGKRQMIEIGKALLRDARIIAFDEPTSSLSARETQTLMRIIRDLRAEGRAILYVSHRMEEVFALCDSLTVLRDGRHVVDYPAMDGVDQARLITAMAGRTIADIYDYRARPLGDEVLAAEGLLGPGLSRPLDVSVRRGEILGFFGLIGAGRSELFKLLYGATAPTAGHLRLRGGPVVFDTPRQAIAAGLALCPEDRKGEGIFPLAAVRENIVVAPRNLDGHPFLDMAAEARRADELIALMRVKTPTAATAIGTLSGGNQQKAVIARWLAADSDILLMDEPTRGIDVGARSEIYDHIYRLAEAGKTILFASSDMPEVMGVADRIVVMREGAIAGIVGRDEVTPDLLLRLALPDAAQDAAGAD